MPKPGLGRIILTHILVGPPVGTLSFITLVVTIAAISSKTTPDSIQSFLSVMGPAILMGYVLGAIPAIVTSLLVAWLISRTSRPLHWLVGAPLIGASMSILGLIWAILGPNAGEDRWVLTLAIAFTGAMAALASMLVVLWMMPREPTPPAPAAPRTAA